ncbi:MAG: diguanylate cyclase [Erysipelotrichaceae bacterium]|nr:diguanylate cyclase [Erysipelotrichaceae bacterium]
MGKNKIVNERDIFEHIRQAESFERTSVKDMLEHAQMAHQLSQKHGYQRLMLHSQFLIGKAHMRLGNMEEANRVLLDSFEHVKVLGDLILEAEILNALGTSHVYMHVYDLSFSYYQQALITAKNLEDRILIAKILNNIGEIYNELGDYDQALKYYQESLDNFGNHRLRATQIVNIATIHLKKNELDQAFELLMYGNRIAKENNDLMMKSVSLKHLSSISRMKGNYADATDYLNRSIEIYRETNEMYHIAEAYVEFFNIHLDKKEYELAQQALLSSLEIAQEIGSLPLQASIYPLFVRLFEQTGNHPQALDYAKRKFAVDEEIEENARKLNLRGLQVQLEAMTSFQQKETYRLLNDQLERKASELTAAYHSLEFISEIGRQLTSSTDLEFIYQLIYNEIRTLINMNVFNIGIYNAESQTIDYRFIMEDNERITGRSILLSSTASFAVWSFKNRKSLLVNSRQEDTSDIVSEIRSSYGQPMEAIMFAPLYWEDKTLGVISVQSRTPNVFSTQSLKTLETLASYLSISLININQAMELKEEINKRMKAQMKLHELNIELTNLSKQDPMTGLANRRHFDEYLTLIFENARRSGVPISMLMIDVDHFKLINDYYGHLTGDEIVRHFANIIQSCVNRSTDLVARFGGDEFAIILNDTNLYGAKLIAMKIRQAISDSDVGLIPQRSQRKVTLSIGIASGYAGQFTSSLDLVKKADDALYRAKNTGRDKICVDNEEE